MIFLQIILKTLHEREKDTDLRRIATSLYVKCTQEPKVLRKLGPLS